MSAAAGGRSLARGRRSWGCWLPYSFVLPPLLSASSFLGESAALYVPVPPVPRCTHSVRSNTSPPGFPPLLPLCVPSAQEPNSSPWHMTYSGRLPLHTYMPQRWLLTSECTSRMQPHHNREVLQGGALAPRRQLNRLWLGWPQAGLCNNKSSCPAGTPLVLNVCILSHLSGVLGGGRAGEACARAMCLPCCKQSGAAAGVPIWCPLPADLV